MGALFGCTEVDHGMVVRDVDFPFAAGVGRVILFGLVGKVRHGALSGALFSPDDPDALYPFVGWILSGCIFNSQLFLD